MLTIPIIQRAFIMMHCVSYGIVVINPDNDELFVVNSSHSYFAGAIIAGKPWFMMDQLTTSEQRQKFVDGMTQTERDMFLSDVSGEKGIYLSLLKRCTLASLNPCHNMNKKHSFKGVLVSTKRLCVFWKNT